MTQTHLHESSCFLIHWNALHTLRSIMKHTWIYHEKTRLQGQPMLACLTVSYYITIRNRKTDYYIPKYVVPPNIWLFITEALNSFRPKQTWGTVWMTNLPSAETSSSVLKFSEQGFITGSWCYGIYRRGWTKASARQSIPLCHQFRYLFWPST